MSTEITLSLAQLLLVQGSITLISFVLGLIAKRAYKNIVQDTEHEYSVPVKSKYKTTENFLKLFNKH